MKTKKRFLSILLSLVMVLGLMPGMSLTAYAAETKTVTINYYGNGNTTGSAPDGVTNHVAGEPYTILDSNMTKKIHGVEVAFLGWSAKADGTGEEEQAKLQRVLERIR